jgi:hypothetical protein
MRPWLGPGAVFNATWPSHAHAPFGKSLPWCGGPCFVLLFFFYFSDTHCVRNALGGWLKSVFNPIYGGCRCPLPSLAVASASALLFRGLARRAAITSGPTDGRRCPRCGALLKLKRGLCVRSSRSRSGSAARLTARPGQAPHESYRSNSKRHFKARRSFFCLWRDVGGGCFWLRSARPHAGLACVLRFCCDCALLTCWDLGSPIDARGLTPKILARFPPNLARRHPPSAPHPAGTSIGRGAPPGGGLKKMQHQDTKPAGGRRGRLVGG